MLSNVVASRNAVKSREGSFDCECEISDKVAYKGTFKGRFQISTNNENISSILIETDCQDWDKTQVYEVGFEVYLPQKDAHPKLGYQFERWISSESQVTGCHEICFGDISKRLHEVEVSIKACIPVMKLSQYPVVYSMPLKMLNQTINAQFEYLKKNGVDMKASDSHPNVIKTSMNHIEFIYGQHLNFQNKKFILKPPTLQLLKKFREGRKVEILDQMIECLRAQEEPRKAVEVDIVTIESSTEPTEPQRSNGTNANEELRERVEISPETLRLLDDDTADVGSTSQTAEQETERSQRAVNPPKRRFELPARRMVPRPRNAPIADSSRKRKCTNYIPNRCF